MDGSTGGRLGPVAVEKIEQWPLDRLRPYERNPRLHSESQVTGIAASILRFGFLNPILVDTEAGVIAGHGRLAAAKTLELETVPVVVLDHLSPEERRAYLIADNRLAEQASWDEALLGEELDALRLEGFDDLSVIGFSDQELAGLLDPPEVEEVPAPTPPEDPVTRFGDLWILGSHRLLCGNSADSADVDRLLAGEPVHLINTDPPYNVKVEPRSNNAIAAGLSSFQSAKTRKGLKHHQALDLARHPEKAKGTGRMRAKDRPLLNDFLSDEAFDDLLLAWFGNLSRVLLPGRSFYIWGGYANCANYPPVLKATGLYFSQSIIWVKEHPVLTRKDYMGNHEWAFYGWKEGAGHHFYGPTNAVDVWAVKKVNPQSMIHLTEKPAELAVRAIQHASKSGEHVLDLFGGSGSTLIGAEQTGRRCFAMELDLAYCDVIVRRWQDASGESATLDGEGETFGAVAEARGVDIAEDDASPDGDGGEVDGS